MTRPCLVSRACIAARARKLSFGRRYSRSVSLALGARGDTGGHHHPGAHHHHELRDQQAAEASDQPVLYYANPEDPSQVYSHQQGERDAGDM